MWHAEWALLELREEETGTPVCMMVVWTWGKQAEGQFGSIGGRVDSASDELLVERLRN